MISQKHFVNAANELGIALMDIRSMFEHDTALGREGRNAARETGFSRALSAIVRTFKESNPKFDEELFRNAIEYRAATGKLVRIGQRNFEVPA